MTKYLIILFALFMSCAAYAQAPVSNPNQLVPNLAILNIRPVLVDAGFSTEIDTGSDNVQYLIIRKGNSTAILKPRVCSSENNCAGLLMVAFANRPASFEVANEFNLLSPPTRAAIVENSIVLQRYLIADFGTTRGSLAVNANVFMQSIDTWLQFSESKTITANHLTTIVRPSDSPIVEAGFSSDADDFVRGLLSQKHLFNLARSAKSTD